MFYPVVNVGNPSGSVQITPSAVLMCGSSEEGAQSLPSNAGVDTCVIEIHFGKCFFEQWTPKTRMAIFTHSGKVRVPRLPRLDQRRQYAAIFKANRIINSQEPGPTPQIQLDRVDSSFVGFRLYKRLFHQVGTSTQYYKRSYQIAITGFPLRYFIDPTQGV